MNFYNYPYLNPASTSLFSSLFRNKINWSGLLENTQRILKLVNQAVPIVKQVPPIYRNAKTMFKVMNEFRKVDTPQSTENTNSSTPSTPSFNNANDQTQQKTTNPTYQSGPTFFL